MEVQVSQDFDMQTYSQETKKLKLSVKRGKCGRKRLRKLINNFFQQLSLIQVKSI